MSIGHSHNRVGRPALMRSYLLVAAVVAAMLCGCESSPTRTPADETLPDLQEVRSQVTPVTAPTSPSPQRADRVLARIRKIELPYDVPLTSAWELADERALPTLARGVWHANGLRLGLLPWSALKEFDERLPRPMTVRDRQMVVTQFPMPLASTPHLVGTVTVDLTIPPRAVQEERITGGRVRLLTRMNSHSGNIIVELLPQHYQPKLSIIPRDPLQKQLDGRVYDELAVRVSVPRNKMLLIGLARPQYDAWFAQNAPTPEPSSAQQPTDTDTTGSQPQSPIQTPEPQPADPDQPPRELLPPPLKNHLGKALFTDGQRDGSTQVLLLVSVEPLASPSPINPQPTSPAQPPALP